MQDFKKDSKSHFAPIKKYWIPLADDRTRNVCAVYDSIFNKETWVKTGTVVCFVNTQIASFSRSWSFSCPTRKVIHYLFSVVERRLITFISSKHTYETHILVSTNTLTFSPQIFSIFLPLHTISTQSRFLSAPILLLQHRQQKTSSTCFLCNNS
jgi:hypothetical protein